MWLDENALKGSKLLIFCIRLKMAREAGLPLTTVACIRRVGNFLKKFYTKHVDMNCGGAAHWTLQLPQEQKTRV
jgi:hypothetical protein